MLFLIHEQKDRNEVIDHGANAEWEIADAIFPIRRIPVVERFNQLLEDFQNDQDDPKDKEDSFVCFLFRVSKEQWNQYRQGDDWD